MWVTPQNAGQRLRKQKDSIRHEEAFILATAPPNRPNLEYPQQFSTLKSFALATEHAMAFT